MLNTIYKVKNSLDRNVVCNAQLAYYKTLIGAEKLKDSILTKKEKTEEESFEEKTEGKWKASSKKKKGFFNFRHKKSDVVDDIEFFDDDTNFCEEESVEEQEEDDYAEYDESVDNSYEDEEKENYFEAIENICGSSSHAMFYFDHHEGHYQCRFDFIQSIFKKSETLSMDELVETANQAMTEDGLYEKTMNGKEPHAYYNLKKNQRFANIGLMSSFLRDTYHLTLKEINILLNEKEYKRETNEESIHLFKLLPNNCEILVSNMTKQGVLTGTINVLDIEEEEIED